MLYLNGKFLAKEAAKISVLDRGFLFADGVYEVVPVYQGKPFYLLAHLSRLNTSLLAVNITNPHSNDQWRGIIEKLIDYSQEKTLSIYIQVTRGCANSRQHIGQNNLTPTVLAKAKPLIPPDLPKLLKPHFVITQPDIRWHRCDIKSIALLANILLLQEADKQGAEEVLLIRDEIITEGASSNVFIVKDNIIYTHPANTHILGGITRNIVIQSIKSENICLVEQGFPASNINDADEIWITSSTKEIMPITHLNGKILGDGKPSALWRRVYRCFEQIKNNECQLSP